MSGLLICSRDRDRTADSEYSQFICSSQSEKDVRIVQRKRGVSAGSATAVESQRTGHVSRAANPALGSTLLSTQCCSSHRTYDRQCFVVCSCIVNGQKAIAEGIGLVAVAEQEDTRHPCRKGYILADIEGGQ